MFCYNHGIDWDDLGVDERRDIVAAAESRNILDSEEEVDEVE